MRRFYSPIFLVVLVFIICIGGFNEVYANPQADTGSINTESLPVYQDPQPISSISPLTSFFRVILGLGIVLLLIYWLRKMLKKRGNLFFQGRYLSLIDGVNLGPNKGVYLAKLDDKFFLLGVTEYQINLLSQFEEEELSQIIDSISFSDERRTDLSGQEFQSFFQQQLERLKKISKYKKDKDFGRWKQ
ncbi:MAG TPA: flagellar biosynthetic protein FliO [Clostridia bacterium]|jgi:flagellar protein FliO/FliZ|nr:flagellar biosynthetic protein FliO [Clostridia bacterium]